MVHIVAPGVEHGGPADRLVGGAEAVGADGEHDVRLDARARPCSSSPAMRRAPQVGGALGRREAVDARSW